MQNISELQQILELEEIGTDQFRGRNFQAPWGRIFGGQVIAQALRAAYLTVPVGRIAHSLHAYFLEQGALDVPLIFDVERIRDGRNVSTRRVVVKQNDRTIYVSTLSFQETFNGFEHQIAAPKFFPPNDAIEDVRLLQSQFPDAPQVLIDLLKTRPFEFRVVLPQVENPNKGVRQVWLKAKGEGVFTQPENQQFLSYISDYYLLAVSTFPHSNNPFGGDFFMASIDHSLWFHRPFVCTDWIFYDILSLNASGGRGLSQGNFFDQEGTLLATVIQEGVIKPLKI